MEWKNVLVGDVIFLFPVIDSLTVQNERLIDLFDYFFTSFRKIDLFDYS